ncbi:MAG: alpha/beta hydrolase [Alphaproteobacteria bacterium]|nr:alpha/beta hydrolase [Alphaproteobacteria bacterium]
MMPGSERKTAECPGGRISYREAGAGSPLLLMHGVGGNSRSFRCQLEGLADRFRVIAWDAPGYGDSALRVPTLDSYSGAVLELLDHLKIQLSHVLGHSMGGVVAQGVAGLAPDRLECLILSSTFTGYAQPKGSDLSQSWKARLTDIRALSAAEFGRARAKSMLADNAGEAVRTEAASIASEVEHDGLKAASELLHLVDTRGIAGKIAIPTLVITGGQDRIIPPARSSEMADLIPNSQSVEIVEVGHAAYLEDPATYNATLNNFLS